MAAALQQQPCRGARARLLSLGQLDGLRGGRLPRSFPGSFQLQPGRLFGSLQFSLQRLQALALEHGRPSPLASNWSAGMYTPFFSRVACSSALSLSISALSSCGRGLLRAGTYCARSSAAHFADWLLQRLSLDTPLRKAPAPLQAALDSLLRHQSSAPTLMCAVLEIFWLTSGRLRMFLALWA